MSATLHEILERIAEPGEFTPNQTPPILVHGGEHPHINLKSLERTNRQIVLVVHEFLSNEADERQSTALAQIEAELNISMLPFSFPDLESVETVLDELSRHFRVTIDKSRIIRRLNNTPKTTSFCLYAGVFVQTYYK